MLNVSPRVVNTKTCPASTSWTFLPLPPLPTGETDDTTRIVERFGEDILAAGVHNGPQVVYVKPERLRRTGRVCTHRRASSTTRR